MSGSDPGGPWPTPGHAPAAIWSCDPADIKPWSEADKARLKTVMNEMFGGHRQADPAALAATPSHESEKSPPVP